MSTTAKPTTPRNTALDRPAFKVRDLGLAEATDGRIGGTIGRAIKKFEPGGGAPRHTHNTSFHLIFVMRGWFRTEFEGLGEVEDELRGALREGSWGQRLATGTVAGQRAALTRRYGADPDARSHGETFLHLLQQRLQPRGLYFLDEPETPLSPTRVLALLAILKDRIAQDCQFVVATHSPILMALPGAQILLLEADAITPIEYGLVEHVRITRAFLDDPESFLRRL